MLILDSLSQQQLPKQIKCGISYFLRFFIPLVKNSNVCVTHVSFVKNLCNVENENDKNFLVGDCICIDVKSFISMHLGTNAP